MKPQLFILSAELVKSSDIKEIEATHKDMMELGIAKPPYPDFDISCPGSLTFSEKDIERFHESLHFDDVDKVMRVIIEVRESQISNVYVFGDGSYFKGNRDFKSCAGLTDYNRKFCESWLAILIVLLASKGVERELKVDKLAKLGIGKARHKYVYTTTLTLSKTLAGYDSANPKGEGVTKRPHLRRGHIRSQHYGPKSELVKQIWIEPCFVNGYTEAIDPVRVAYNVSRKA